MRKSHADVERRSAFTLLEILVVTVILAILVAVTAPIYQRLAESSRSAACLSNLRQIGVALAAYLSENNNTMPTLRVARGAVTEEVPTIDNTLDRYAKDKQIFACPSDRRAFSKETGTSYAWNVALNGQSVASLNFLGMIADHSRIPIISDKEGFHPYLEDKVNILYADGHATKDLRFFTEK